MKYGAEAFILVEKSLSRMKVTGFSANSNDIRMAKILDPLEERQGMKSIRLANYKQKLAWGITRM